MTRTLFGNELSDYVNNKMDYMLLEHAGFVARPMYACTKQNEGGEMCMKVASMSKYIQLGEDRSHYRCTKCREEDRADSALVSDSVALRVLHLYILVRAGTKTTIMRSKPYKLCLHAPPSRWAWGKDLGQLPELIQAVPTSISRAKGVFYDYSDAETEAIWCYPCSHEGTPQ